MMTDGNKICDMSVDCFETLGTSSIYEHFDSSFLGNIKASIHDFLRRLRSENKFQNLEAKISALL